MPFASTREDLQPMLCQIREPGTFSEVKELKTYELRSLSGSRRKTPGRRFAAAAKVSRYGVASKGPLLTPPGSPAVAEYQPSRNNMSQAGRAGAENTKLTPSSLCSRPTDLLLFSACRGLGCMEMEGELCCWPL